MDSSSIYVAFPMQGLCFNREVETLFVTGTPDYLTKFEVKGELFLGKKVKTPLNNEELAGIGRHLLSLISRVDPEQKLTLDSLVVFPDVNFCKPV